MLPDGFHWVDRWQNAGGELAVEHAGKQVVMLLQKVDGSWFARFDTHRPDACAARACTNFESGKAGIETWVCRHAARLRAEVAAMPGRPKMPWLPKG